MATTTNFGWTTPDDTALVKDGASAIRTLGSAIDTSMAQLKGGTTGQILSKTSNSDMAFTWIANDQGDITAVTAGTGLTGGGTTGAVTLALDSTAVISPTIVDAKGDIIAATGADAVTRLAVGANNTVLTADSTTATGLKWAAVSSGANWSLVNAGGTALTAATTITVSGISNADKIMILIDSASSVNAADFMSIRFNSDSGTNYNQFGGIYIFDSAYAAGNFGGQVATSAAQIRLALMGSNANSAMSGYLQMSGCNSSGAKVFQSAGFSSAGTSGNGQRHWMTGGYYNSSSTISSISIISGSGNFDSGTIYVYTSA